MRELSCDEVVERLPALVVGDLGEAELGEIDGHVSECAWCAGEVKASRALSRALDQLAASGGIEQRVAAGLPLLRARLRSALPRRALYDRMESPLGPLHMVVSDDGLCAVRLRGSEEELFAWSREVNLVLGYDRSSLRSFRIQLAEYFAGERRHFDLPVDLSLARPFAREVLSAAARVPFGQLASYRDIAVARGKPGATRAVGNALGSNPVPIVVPCHRIVRSDGSLGGYTGGLEIKRHLLKLEGTLLVN